MDTYNAVAEASAAMGSQAGSVFQSIIEGAKNTGRVSINPFQLQGTGVGVQDIAAQLAKRMHVGINDALIALQQGRVKVNDAAAAIRDAVEARFGEVNAKMKLGQPLENLKNRLASLGESIHIDAFLKSLESVESLLDKSSVAGDVLRTMLEAASNALGGGGDAAATLKDWLEKLELGALKLEIAFFKARNKIRDALKNDYPELDKLKEQLEALTPSIRGHRGTPRSSPRNTSLSSAIAAEKLAVALEKIKAGTAGISISSILSAATGGLVGGGPPGTVTAPAHAEGGVVHEPAPGEFLASVAPGEMILPKRAAEDLSQSKGGARGGGGGNVTHIEINVSVRRRRGRVEGPREELRGRLDEGPPGRVGLRRDPGAERPERMSLLPDAVRVNAIEYAWTSSAFRVDGLLMVGFHVARLRRGPRDAARLLQRPGPAPARDVGGPVPDREVPDPGAPGDGEGAEGVPIRSGAARGGLTSYGQAVFTLSLSLMADDAPDFDPSTTRSSPGVSHRRREGDDRRGGPAPW